MVYRRFEKTGTRGDRRHLGKAGRRTGTDKEDKYELDDQLLNVIAKVLSYDAEDRFQTADEFIKAIDGEIKIERQSTKRKFLSQQSRISLSPQKQRKGGRLCCCGRHGGTEAADA